MAKVQVLGQRCPHGDKMLIRGVFTQRKKLWEAMAKAIGGKALDGLLLFDDMTGKTSPSNYNALCKLLRETGRAALVEEESKLRVFQVVDAATNEIRAWDMNEEGPVCNPIEK